MVAYEAPTTSFIDVQTEGVLCGSDKSGGLSGGGIGDGSGDFGDWN